MDLVSLGAQLNAGTVIPEGIVVLTILIILIGDLIQGRSSSAWTPYAAIRGFPRDGRCPRISMGSG